MIKLISYYDKKISKSSSIKKINAAIANDEMVWIDFEAPEDKEIEVLKDVFKFHPLAIEDCLHKLQRPKVDNYKDYYFIVLNEFAEEHTNKYFKSTQLYVFLGINYIVTLHWDNVKVINDTVKEVINSPYLFERGIDFILYTILDNMVDNYFPLSESISDKIDMIEESILRNPKKKVQDDILILKRNILKFRKVLSPQRDALNTLLRHDFPLIKEENRLYYMDVYDHMLRIYDQLDTYMELLASTMDLYMTQISNRMNEVMKVLTMITTIMMPLSLIAGIYGMNFRYIPFLNSKYGFYGTLGIMAFIAIGEFIYFKKKKWL